MFGNLINNKQLLELENSNVIDITPFDDELLKAAHYPLHALTVRTRSNDGHWKRVHSFQEDKTPYILEPNEYVVVDLQEIIKVKQGIVGHLVPASNVIELGLGITAGRLEHPFGQRGESLRLGVKNLLSVPSEIKPLHKLAYIHFFDLRGLASKTITISQAELDFFNRRISEARKSRAQDAGPLYDPDPDYDVNLGRK